MTYMRPVSITMADILRDGGSYFLLYEGSDSKRYSLSLPVELHNDVRVGYGNPVLRNPKDEATVLSWTEAAALAQELVPLAMHLVLEGGQTRARECLSFLELGGALAPDRPTSI